LKIDKSKYQDFIKICRVCLDKSFSKVSKRPNGNPVALNRLPSRRRINNFESEKRRVSQLSIPGVDFTNIFTSRFYVHSSQKRKSQSSRQYLFTLLGSERVNAVRRTLMKLSPDESEKRIIKLNYRKGYQCIQNIECFRYPPFLVIRSEHD